VTGVVVFAAGWRTITDGGAHSLYLWSLIACIGFVAAAVAVDWGGLGSGSRVLFVALLILGCYMIARGARARRELVAGPGRAPSRYMDDVGFTLIALFVAFVVIAALDLGASGFVAVLIAVLGVLIGHRALAELKRQRSGAGGFPTRLSPSR
jgi:hypothetical protein